MNVIRLNEHLTDNDDAIATILENIGCDNIVYNAKRQEFRCSREPGKNPSAVWIDATTLRFKCFSTNEQGSIYNLVMIKKGFNFPESLKWIAKLLKINTEELQNNIVLPFNGFYKNLLHNINEPELTMPRYEASILSEFGSIPNLRFLKDGIDLQTQEKFKVGYDLDTDRITIPQWDMCGNLVGVMGRSNDDNIPYEYRWLPIIPCSRSYTLFGYHFNYSYIQQQQLCIICESEKGVMQMTSMGFKYGLATCTKSISPVQERYLKALRVDKIIIAYDQGVSQEELEHEANKLKMNNPIYKNHIGYVYDPNGEILDLNQKQSPMDVGYDKFKTLINNYTRWI